MIRQDLWNQTGGRMTLGSSGLTGSNTSDWEMWRRDPTRNPSLQRATPDDEVLAYETQQSRLQHELLMKEKAKRLQQNIGMLKQANAQPFGVGIFDAPDAPNDVAIQRNIQRYVDAGTRGMNASAASEKERERRYIQNLQIRKQLQDSALDRAKFQQGLFQDQRDFKFDVNKELARRKYLEDVQTNQMIGQQQGRHDNAAELAFEMVRDFGMEPEEAIKVFGVDPQSADVLRSVGRMVGGQASARDEQGQDWVELLNQMELAQRKASPDFEPDLPSAKTWWGGTNKEQKALNDAEIARFSDRSKLPPMKSKEMLDLLDAAEKRGLSYNPNQGFFLPQRNMGGAAPTASPTPAHPQFIGDGIPVVTSREQGILLNRTLGPGKKVAIPDGKGSYYVQYTR